MPKKLIGKSLEQIKVAITKALADAPTIAGIEAVKHFKASFKNQGFTDGSLQKWDKRKSDKDSDRAILVKSGRLRRSPKEIRKTKDSVTVGVDLSEVPYAEAHNEGGTQNVRAHKRRAESGRRGNGVDAKVKAHTREMPKRQFIGKSKVLDDTINRKIESAINKELNS